MFWFVNRDISKWLIYSWDIKNIESAYKASEALAWYDAVNNKWWDMPVAFINDSIELYWKTYDYSLPVVSIDTTTDEWVIKLDEYDDKTEDLYEFLTNLSTWKMIDDILFWFWQKILAVYKVIDLDWSIVFYKYKAWDKWFVTTWLSYETIDEQSALVMMKEYIDWYIADYEYNIMVGKKKTPIKIWQDYKIKIPWTDETTIIKNNYTASLRYKAFGRAAEERMNKNRLDELPPLLYNWQYDLIKRMWKRTFITNLRRSGKSLVMAFLAIRFLFKSMRHVTNRSITIIYVGQTLPKMKPFFRYLKKIVESFSDEKDYFFKVLDWDMSISFMEWKKEIATITLIADSQKDPWVWDNCDLLMIDEVAKISEWTWDLIKPYVLNQDADLIAATTMYKWLKKTRAYKLLAEYERMAIKEKDIDNLIILRYKELKWIEAEYNSKSITKAEYWQKMLKFRAKMDQRYVWIRYTIDDNPEQYPPKKAAKIKWEVLTTDPEAYFSEYYSRFSDEWKVFKFNKCLTHTKDIVENKYKVVVAAYDPALRSDMSAVTILWYNQYLKRVVVIEEHEINLISKTSYWQQADEIKNIIEAAGKKYLEYPDDKVRFVMDWTHPWVADVMIIKWLYPYLRIFYIWWEEARWSSIPQEVKVWKKVLVNISQDLLREWKVLINRWLVETIKQLENFYEIDTNKFEWVWSNDDFVNSMMVWFYYIYDTLWYKYSLMSNESDTDITGGNRDMTSEEMKEFIQWKKDKIKDESKQYNNSLEYFKKFVY